MREIAVWRLYLLRAAYLLLIVGLGPSVWPSLIDHSPEWPRMTSVVIAMLCALSALSLLGLRYPLLLRKGEGEWHNLDRRRLAGTARQLPTRAGACSIGP